MEYNKKKKKNSAHLLKKYKLIYVSENPSQENSDSTRVPLFMLQALHLFTISVLCNASHNLMPCCVPKTYFHAVQKPLMKRLRGIQCCVCQEKLSKAATCSTCLSMVRECYMYVVLFRFSLSAYFSLSCCESSFIFCTHLYNFSGLQDLGNSLIACTKHVYIIFILLEQISRKIIMYV